MVQKGVGVAVDVDAKEFGCTFTKTLQAAGIKFEISFVTETSSVRRYLL